MRRRGAADAGYTLTELLVILALSGVIGTIVVAATTTGLHKQTQVQDRSDAMSQVRTAMQRVERDIRSSNPLEAARGDQIVVQEVQATVTRTVTYSVIADGTKSELVKNETDVSSSGATTQVPQFVELANIVNPASSPVFTFEPTTTYTPPADGGVSATTCAIAGTSPTAYDPTCIGTVVMHLMVQPASLGTPIDITDDGTDLRNPG